MKRAPSLLPAPVSPAPEAALDASRRGANPFMPDAQILINASGDGAALTFTASDGREVFRIDGAGRAIVNPAFTLDQAAAAFWDAVQDLATKRLDAERLRAHLRAHWLTLEGHALMEAHGWVIGVACALERRRGCDPRQMDDLIAELRRSKGPR